jgi:hypothetical protein
MKKVLMKSSFAGQVNWPAGSVQEIDDDEAQRLVEHGYADYADSEDDDIPNADKRSTRVDKRSKRR